MADGKNYRGNPYFSSAFCKAQKSWHKFANSSDKFQNYPTYSEDVSHFYFHLRAWFSKLFKGSLQKKSALQMSVSDFSHSLPPSLPIRLKCPPGPKNEHFFPVKKKLALLDSWKPKHRRYKLTLKNWSLPRFLFF